MLPESAIKFYLKPQPSSLVLNPVIINPSVQLLTEKRAKKVFAASVRH
jgi:hypothetical protein